MREYQTNQRQALLSFFGANPDRKMTVDEIMEELPERASISRSAVYRNIDKMVQDGLLDKSFIPGGRKSAYQFVRCDKDCRRVHLRCEKCGRLMHMEHEKDESRLNELLAENGFQIDGQAAVIVGVCKDCNKRED